MKLFGKKPKKTEEELKKEREEAIAKTSNSLKLQIRTLEKKRDMMLSKVVEAKGKGLKEQETQARNLLKQTMASIKREEGMLMTLELAVEARDLAQLNANFLKSIGDLSDDILSSGKEMSSSNVKKVEDKYLHAVYESNRQKEKIDEMLSVGEYAGVVNQDTNSYSEFDDEIDSMIENAESNSSMYGNRNKF